MVAEGNKESTESRDQVRRMQFTGNCSRDCDGELTLEERPKGDEGMNSHVHVVQEYLAEETRVGLGSWLT